VVNWKSIILFLLFLSLFSPICFAQNWDLNILKSINPTHPDSDYWIQTSASAYWIPSLILIGSYGYALVEHNNHIKQNVSELLISIMISQIITEAIKISANRERPADRYPGEIFDISVTHGASFPSGHTSLAFATATSLSLEYKKWYVVVPAYFWAGSVAYSRMYLGKHYPSDVLGGIIVGIGSAYLAHWINKKIFKDKHMVYEHS
jgi:membrane-associated phospholipid phosphatase